MKSDHETYEGPKYYSQSNDYILDLLVPSNQIRISNCPAGFLNVKDCLNLHGLRGRELGSFLWKGHVGRDIFQIADNHRAKNFRWAITDKETRRPNEIFEIRKLQKQIKIPLFPKLRQIVQFCKGKNVPKL